MVLSKNTVSTNHLSCGGWFEEHNPIMNVTQLIKNNDPVALSLLFNLRSNAPGHITLLLLLKQMEQTTQQEGFKGF